MNTKADRIALYGVALIPIIIIGLLAFLMWPRVPLKIHSFEVYEAVGGDRTMKAYTLRAGDELEFEINFTKYIDAQAEVTVLLKQQKNGYLYPYDRISTTRMPLGNHHYKSAISISKVTPPGTYVLIRTYRYDINPFNHPEVTVTSNEFEVKGRIPDHIELIREGNLISQQNQKRLDKIEREMMKK